MRRPSTQTNRTVQGGAQINPSTTIPERPRVVRVDDMTDIQHTILSLKRDIDDVKSSISGFDILRGEVGTNNGMSKQIHQVDIQTKQLRRKVDSLKSEIAPERGVSKRVTSIEAKLVYTTNKFEAHREEQEKTYASLSDQFEAYKEEQKKTYARLSDQFETYKEEQEKAYTSLSNKLLGIDTQIASHPVLQMLSLRMDTIESSIDRLMNTFSGLSQVPVMQRRVTGSRPIVDEGKSIQFGTLHRITSH